jgi:hypothetical protein
MAITRGLLTVLQLSLLRSRALCAEPGAQQRGLGASYALHWLERLRLQRQLSRGGVEAPTDLECSIMIDSISHSRLVM